MSETLQSPVPIESKYLRLDEIRRQNEDFIDDIFLAQAQKDRNLIVEEDDYIVTAEVVGEPYGAETIRGSYSIVELKHGKPDAEDRYQLTIRDLIGHDHGITELNNVTYKFKNDWDPLAGESFYSDDEHIGWKADRSEELGLQLYLTQVLQSIQRSEAVAA